MPKQRIAHGQTIDTASTEEIAELLAQAFSQQRPLEYRRFKNVINLDGTGTGLTKAADILVPSQYDLLLERVTIGGPGAVGAVVTIYENQVQDTDLLEVIGPIGAVGKYSDSFSNTMYVTANSAVLINVTSGAVSSQVTYNLQGRLIEKS